MLQAVRLRIENASKTPNADTCLEFCQDRAVRRCDRILFHSQKLVPVRVLLGGLLLRFDLFAVLNRLFHFFHRAVRDWKLQSLSYQNSGKRFGLDYKGFFELLIVFISILQVPHLQHHHIFVLIRKFCADWDLLL